jgi:hypothetical protein
MAFDGAWWCEMASAGVGWCAVAPYETRSASAMPSIPHDTRRRVSQLTTRFVNALQTHHHTRLFHVVSGSRTQIDAIVFSTRATNNVAAICGVTLRPM